MKENAALVVVDMLYDFIDGTLACENAVEAVDNAVGFIEKCTAGASVDDAGIFGTFPILFVCDHHPSDHSSFMDYGGIWPVHCVAGTRGGDVHEKLKPYVVDELTFNKGCDRLQEQYSGLEGRNGAGQTLGEVLAMLDIENVYICGIATEYCVKNTSEDLAKAGFNVCILENALAWVDRQGHLDTIAQLKKNGFSFE